MRMRKQYTSSAYANKTQFQFIRVVPTGQQLLKLRVWGLLPASLFALCFPVYCQAFDLPCSCSCVIGIVLWVMKGFNQNIDGGIGIRLLFISTSNQQALLKINQEQVAQSIKRYNSYPTRKIFPVKECNSGITAFNRMAKDPYVKQL